MSDPPFPDPDDALPVEPGCSRCPELAAARERIAWGNGPADADVVVVGEAPGAGTPDADRWKGGNWTGLAYTARHSGRIVRDLVADAFASVAPDGHSDGNAADAADHPGVFYTNAVKCFPPDGEGSNREPRASELANCLTHLEAEIEAVDPAVVVPTGRHATRVLFEAAGRDLDGFLDAVLDPVPCDPLGVVVLPVLHPAYQHLWLSRLGYEYDDYVADLGSALDSLA